jgi:hypothetical protein
LWFPPPACAHPEESAEPAPESPNREDTMKKDAPTLAASLPAKPDAPASLRIKSGVKAGDPAGIRYTGFNHNETALRAR